MNKIFRNQNHSIQFNFQHFIYDHYQNINNMKKGLILILINRSIKTNEWNSKIACDNIDDDDGDVFEFVNYQLVVVRNRKNKKINAC